MITCTNCKAADGRPVFRTNPLGETPAGWMCKPCIDKLHDSSLIDDETLEIATIISEACPICNGRGGKPWVDIRPGREGTWRIACLTCRGSGKIKPSDLLRAAVTSLGVAEPGGWVPVGERLPEFGADVLLLYASQEGKGRQTIGRLAHTGINDWAAEPQNVWLNNYEPTHWQPLPQAPQA